jgi:hypothetical protein
MRWGAAGGRESSRLIAPFGRFGVQRVDKDVATQGAPEFWAA